MAEKNYSEDRIWEKSTEQETVKGETNEGACVLLRESSGNEGTCSNCSVRVRTLFAFSFPG